MRGYYNDNDKKCCAWMEELMRDGLIPEGTVSDQDVRDIEPDELSEYEQVHLFAGIGGWAYALRLAGWGDRPVWTGSCPCQPFSVAGKGGGTDDPRHVWPAFRWLITQCRPPIVFGEQVASKAGRAWLAGVRADLEALGYGVGAADLCAASVGAPHIRARLWWVAHTNTERDGVQGGAAQAADEEREGVPAQQLPGLLQPHPWPTLSGAKLWTRTHGIPADMGVSAGNRAIGNAIVPQVAAQFVMAYMEATDALDT